MRLVLIFLLAAGPVWAYDANGVALGAPEQVVSKHFPNAYCKPLEWQSLAADRRCDDSRIRLGGVKARITFYLKNDALEAFELRFDAKDAKRLVAALKKRYGAPASEGREITVRAGEAERELYKVLWRNGRERATLSAEPETRRASLLVSRGDFESQIYRVR